jgi:hypothetical protein
MNLKIPILLCGFASLFGVAMGQTPMTLQNTNQMKWGPAPAFLPKGAKLAVLS